MSEVKQLVSVIPQSDYLRMPWKNGLGETLEIAVQREDDQVLYRVSQASVVEDGVFSDFSGLQRTLVLLKGDGMLLIHQSGSEEYRHNLTQPLSIANFAGSDVTSAYLAGGRIEDLNIMVREGSVQSDVRAVRCPESFVMDFTHQTLFNFFYANSDCQLVIETESESVTVTVSSQDTVCFHDTANVTLTEGEGVTISINQMVSP